MSIPPGMKLVKIPVAMSIVPLYPDNRQGVKDAKVLLELRQQKDCITNFCASCFKSNLPQNSICGNCKLVRYCGKECQLSHWKKDHKHFCEKLNSYKDFYNLINRALYGSDSSKSIIDCTFFQIAVFNNPQALPYKYSENNSPDFILDTFNKLNKHNLDTPIGKCFAGRAIIVLFPNKNEANVPQLQGEEFAKMLSLFNASLFLAIGSGFVLYNSFNRMSFETDATSNSGLDKTAAVSESEKTG